MKTRIQIFLKYILDVLFLPIILLAALIAKIVVKRKKRVLIGLMANNNMVHIRNALRQRHYDVLVVPWIIPPNERGVIDYDLDIQSKYPWLYNNFIGHQILIYCFFIWALFQFDLIITHFQNRLLDRTGFLKWYEFQLLHFCGKKIILNPYGGDIQSSDFWKNSDRKTHQILYEGVMKDPYYSQVDSSFIRKNNAYGQQHADKLIVSLEWPDYLHRADYYFHMRCIDVPESYSNHKTNHKILKIVHATNHDHFKGTKYLTDAVEKINLKEQRCELLILRGVSNQEVQDALTKSDVVFDQLLLGAYGRLAIEAMAMGKPVICNLRDDLRVHYDFWDDCPVIQADIDNIEAVILDLINKPRESLEKLGEQSYDYAKAYHSPEYVGRKLDEIIQETLS